MYEKGRAWIELDMNNLRHNTGVLRGLLPPACKLMPAVKANAYGHGAIPIARELNGLGVDAFCVATLREGAELRQNGITGDILILGYTSPEDFSALCQYDLMQTVVDCSYAEQLNAFGRRIRVHIKIDTGMHRLGEWCTHTRQITRIFACENLIVDGMYTHLCAADAPDESDYTRRQIRYFYALAQALEKYAIPLPKLHIQSSYGVLNCPDLRCDYARVGIAMYGVFSNAGDAEKYPVSLLPVLSVRARVEMVKPLSCGEGVGYGLQFKADRDMKIAIIAIGYADGIPRALSCGAGAVLMHGKRVRIVGRICMDRLTVDVTDLPEARQGDIATIIGKDGHVSISACDIAAKTETISNEILSRLGERLVRLIENDTALAMPRALEYAFA